MVISSHMGPTHSRWSALDEIPEVEKVKHQSGSGWIWNWGNFELDFKFISWISKWSFNFVQLSSNGCNFFISALICTPFEALNFWLLELQNDIYYD